MINNRYSHREMDNENKRNWNMKIIEALFTQPCVNTIRGWGEGGGWGWNNLEPRKAEKHNCL